MMMSRGSSLKWGRKKIRSGPSVEPPLKSPPPKISVPCSKRLKRSYDTTPNEDVKDVCMCIRLEFEEPLGDDNVNVKWLRVKIPGILLHKRGGGEGYSPTSPLDLPIITCYHDDDDEDEDEDDGPSLYWDSFCCHLHPLNGPFDFPPLVQEDPRPYTSWIRCAPLGSVMYALGADETHIPACRDIDFQATGQVRPPNPLVTTKAITGGRGSGSVKPPSRNRNSSRTCSNHASHCLHFCDFSKQNPKWEISPTPLISPRLWPKLVSMEGKLYAFGGDLLTDHQSPFAEIFDPEVGYWSPLPDPPFGKLADYELFVFPLHKSRCILLIGYVSGVVYTFNTSSWYWSPFHASSHLCGLLHFHGWDDFSLPVISDETLYWIDRLGRLCAYILEDDGRYFVGRISVFEDGTTNEHHIINEVLNSKGRNDSYTLALLPMSANLLGFLWCEMHFAGGIRCASTLHITILRISLHKEIDLEHIDSDTDEDPELSLTASAVACLCFPFLRDITSVIDAYLIDDDKESWQLMSSCSSYCTVNDRARY